MKTAVAVVVLALSLPLFCQSKEDAAIGTAERGYFNVRQIAPGVYAVIRKDPPGLMCVGNSVFIVNDKDVVVVDTGGSRSEAREMIAALRKLTPKPVRYVINTHWHDDHILGNQEFRDAFPQAEFIAHVTLREYLPGKGVAARKQMLEGAPKVVAQMRQLLRTNKSFSGKELTLQERASYISDIKLVDRYLAETPGTEIVLPDITVADKLTLYRGTRKIEVEQLGRGHTSGDLVVHLPEEGVVIAGDLVVWPVPLIGSDQSHVGDWVRSLEKLRALKPKMIVPGHGPVMRDDTYVRTVQEMLASVQQQTQAAVTRGETLEQARKSVNLESFRRELAGEDKVRNLLFSNYVVSPAIAAAYREERGGK